MKYYIIGLLLVINGILNAQNKEEKIVSFKNLTSVDFKVNDYKNTFFIMSEGSFAEEKDNYYNFDEKNVTQLNSIFNKYMLQERFSSGIYNNHYISDNGCVKASEVMLVITISYGMGEYEYCLLVTDKNLALNLLEDIDTIFGNEHKMSKLINEIQNSK